jgi:membrane fusion protein (multidrug efflux system)
LKVPCVLVLGWLVFLSACDGKDAAVEPPPLAVSVAEVEQAEIPVYMEHVGTTEAVNTVEVRARVRGVLEKVAFKEGSDVKQGDLLFIIERAPYKAALDRAKGDLARADATLARTVADYKRTQELAAREVSSQADLDHARAARDEASASSTALRAAVEQAELDLGYTEVHAPISGRIGRLHVSQGNLVGGTEETPLATIVQLDPIYIYWSPSEKERLDVLRERKEGRYVQRSEIEVRAMLSDESEHPYPGTLDFVDNTVDLTAGTVRVRAVFPNPDGTLLPGQYAKLRVRVASALPALLVPAQAILEEQGGSSVWVVQDDGTIESRRIVTSFTHEDKRVVESGVVAGEKVATDNLGKLRGGMRVTINSPTSSPL